MEISKELLRPIVRVGEAPPLAAYGHRSFHISFRDGTGCGRGCWFALGLVFAFSVSPSNIKTSKN